MANDHRAVIDATTGTVLDCTNLYYVAASESRLDQASNSDSSAFQLTRRKKDTLWINPNLLEAILRRDAEAIGRLLGF